jgi:hypothetical protein
LRWEKIETKMGKKLEKNQGKKKDSWFKFLLYFLSNKFFFQVIRGVMTG